MRVRRWNQPGTAAATTPPPSTAGAGVGGGGGDRDGAGASDRNKEEEVEAEQEKGGDFGPEHLVCVPGGLRPSACLALLREAVEAVRHA